MQTITLNKNTFFWGVGNILLNFENRGPVSIDFDKLPLADKTIIKNSFFMDKITVSDELRDAINTFVKPANLTPDNLKVGTKTIDSFIQQQTEKRKEVIAFLNGTLGKIMKDIGGCDDVRKVQLMIKLEEENKKRTKVLDALNSRFSFLTKDLPKNESNSNLELEEGMTDEEGQEVQIVK